MTAAAPAPRSGRPSPASVRVLASWWPPLATWLAATTATLATCAATGWPPFDPGRTWARWDSGLYLSIARGGYDLFPCAAPQPPGTWCGNAGWFPAYPWLTGGLHLLGLPLEPTALALSWLAFAATLLLLWATLLERRRSAAAVGALLFAAFAPGLVYDYAIFPLSLLSLFTVAFFALLHRGRPAGAGIAGAGAALSYPIGLVAAPAGALWVLLTHRDLRAPARIRRAGVVLGPTVVAVALLALDQRLETGRWNAYLLVQDKYGHGLRDPLATVHAALATVWADSPLRLASAPAVQTLLVTFVLGCVLVELLLRRRSAGRIELLVALWAVAAWVLPLAAGNVSAYRSQAALLPLALLVRRLPRTLLAVTVAATIAVSIPMIRLFLRGVLV